MRSQYIVMDFDTFEFFNACATCCPISTHKSFATD